MQIFFVTTVHAHRKLETRMIVQFITFVSTFTELALLTFRDVLSLYRAKAADESPADIIR